MTAPDVYGPGEVAAHLGVTLERVRQLAKQPAFPPARQLEIGRVWDAPAIRAWQIARKQPRRAAITTVHKSWLQHGNISRAARRAGVPPSTARGWLQEIGALE